MKTEIIFSDDDGSHTLLMPGWVLQHVLTQLVKKGKVIHVPRPERSYRTNQRRESNLLLMQSKQFATEYKTRARRVL